MSSATRALRIWLLVLYASVVLMVAVGGITRLTGSGLSMVEWRPVTGWLPPLGEAAWQAEFAAYRSSPQFQQVNAWMQLGDFQRIYFWEYVHRVLGRLVFLLALVPWLVFLRQGALRQGPLGRSAAALLGSVWLLVALQGALGWFMVASGLSARPEVSHLRLAAHLLMAFCLALWVLWLWLELGRGSDQARGASRLGRAAYALVALVLVQCVFGAFMSGLRAGHLFSTFPDMAGEYLPSAFFDGPVLRELVSAPAAIHWTHRALGWLVALVGVALGAGVLLARPGPRAEAAARGLLALVALQFALGALTVVFSVPLTLAVLHQVVALLLASGALVLGQALVSAGPPRPSGAP
jgi:cytochrome c oxidase assembly protein subunit 15